ncbi:hypothetical protein [Streptomyces sp. NPDC054804]
MQAATLVADVGAYTQVGRASWVPSTVTVSESMDVVESVWPSFLLLDTCHVLAPDGW